MTQLDFTKTMTRDRLDLFAEYILQLQRRIGFKVSSRGWCYLLEGERIINKDQFNKVEGWINRCRKEGILPIDFTAEEEGRSFSGVEVPESISPARYAGGYLKASIQCGHWYTPDWWEGEDYYIQVIVEKIDLKTLFLPVCEMYHIPVATSKGWSSMLQRAEYSRRFREAEDRGLQAVLLYCGDHDPDGLRISDTLFSNLDDLKDIVWEDGTHGYDPIDLTIDRFGLNADFIELHNLTWIDNLVTGSGGYIAARAGDSIVQGKTKAGRPHPNFEMEYAQEYLRAHGVRKCEANAIVTMPDTARGLIEESIVNYLGDDALGRFSEKRERVLEEVERFHQTAGLASAINNALGSLK